MYLLSTKAHGVLDYLFGALLLLSPLVFGFAEEGGAAVWVPVLLGVVTVVYSLLTDYELGAYRLIPMPVHLVIDLAAGVLLAASPWLFGFVDQVWAPHVVLGFTEILVPALTSPHSRPSVSYVSLWHGGHGRTR